jgi:hypothetical protein
VGHQRKCSSWSGWKWLQGHLEFAEACDGQSLVQAICWESAFRSLSCASAASSCDSPVLPQGGCGVFEAAGLAEGSPAGSLAGSPLLKVVRHQGRPDSC